MNFYSNFTFSFTVRRISRSKHTHTHSLAHLAVHQFQFDDATNDELLLSNGFCFHRPEQQSCTFIILKNSQLEWPIEWNVMNDAITFEHGMHFAAHPIYSHFDGFVIEMKAQFVREIVHCLKLTSCDEFAIECRNFNGKCEIQNTLQSSAIDRHVVRMVNMIINRHTKKQTEKINSESAPECGGVSDCIRSRYFNCTLTILLRFCLLFTHSTYIPTYSPYIWCK